MIYLVRHGQTEFNRERRLQGHVDSPLTELGLRQAAAAGALLKDLTGGGAGWRVVSSPLGRARRTAEIIAEALGVTEIENEPRLIELSWGAWDGRLRDQLAAEYPEAFGKTGWAFHAPTGESYAQVCARMQSWLDSLPAEPERRVIAVSHGVAGRVLRGVYGSLPEGVVPGQDAPQDAIFRLQGGAIERIACELAA
ncbi:histidine phosphatase family protein [Phenylobacterium deserti]|uniref:Histidine phosphatase family protein n=1 Tax=Phenylobacterium deserti TaxID=1914756 RepID=A0A328ATU9_9CAUL|nr:histidine phosphatase family protein [Phenylobacterium deserti]RAK56934.1 histidine phosphatase family protein [Phenylobacterium deserti]